MKKFSLALLILVSTTSYAQQPGPSSQSDCPDCEINYYGNTTSSHEKDEKKLKKLQRMLGEEESKLDIDKKRLKELKVAQGSTSTNEPQIRSQRETIELDMAALDGLKRRIDSIQEREDNMEDSDCVDCQATYYGKKTLSGVAKTALILNSLYPLVSNGLLVVSQKECDEISIRLYSKPYGQLTDADFKDAAYCGFPLVSPAGGSSATEKPSETQTYGTSGNPTNQTPVHAGSIE